MRVVSVRKVLIAIAHSWDMSSCAPD
jgi:hypothetical protein